MPDVFEMKDPSKLKNHPLSIEIYGEQVDERFAESIKTAGILVPLRVLKDGTVISGRRRRIVAMKLLAGGDKRFTRVPCVVVDGAVKDLDVQAAVIHSNRENERSVEQRGREFVELKRIEIERAAIRQKQAPLRALADKKHRENKDKTVPQNFTEHPLHNGQGEAAVIAAEAVGMSRPTAERVEDALDISDRLKEEGKKEEAEKIVETLNESSTMAALKAAVEAGAIHEVRRAVEDGRLSWDKAADLAKLGAIEQRKRFHEVVKPRPPKSIKAKPGTDKGKIIRTMQGLIKQVIRVLDSRGKDGHHAKCNKAIGDFLEAWDTWK